MKQDAPQPKHALTLYEKMGVSKDVQVLSSEQILHILQKTPPQHVYKRPGKGGGQWDYVTGTYVEKVLNYVFAWDWDFEIKEKIEKQDQLAVLGRLTVRTMNGKSIHKEQWGRADIKKTKQGNYLDYGNDLKAASTDALKKCASLFGIASDVYGKEEFREIEMEKPNGIQEFKQQQQKSQPMEADIVESPVNDQMVDEVAEGIERQAKEQKPAEKQTTVSQEPVVEENQQAVRPAAFGQKTLLAQWSKNGKVALTTEQIDALSFDEASKIIANAKTK